MKATYIEPRICVISVSEIITTSGAGKNENETNPAFIPLPFP